MSTNHSSMNQVPPEFPKVMTRTDIRDEFLWLEEQDSPETRAFIHAEQQRYARYLSQHITLRTRIGARVTQLLTVEKAELPISDHRGGLFFLKRPANSDQPILYHLEENSEATPLITPELFGRGSEVSISLLSVSSTGKYLLIGVRDGGEDVQQLRVYNMNSNELLHDSVPKGYYRGLEFDEGNGAFYYAQEETEGRYQSRKAVRVHILGTAQSKDEEIFYAADSSRIRLILQGASGLSALIYTLASLDVEPETNCFLHQTPFVHKPRPLIKVRGKRFGICAHDDRLLAFTNEHDPHGCVVSLSPNGSDPSQWTEIIPASADDMTGFEGSGDRIVVHYTGARGAFSRVVGASGDPVLEIHYPHPGTCRLGRVDALNDRLFYEYSDLHVPPVVYQVNLTTGVHSEWWRGGSAQPLRIPIVEEHTVPLTDGTSLPLTLVRYGMKMDHGPLLLSAYGSGGVSSTPRFSAFVAVLLEMGFTYATAHVRGGGEHGEAWHLAATRQRKQVSVDDLVASAEWLVSHGHTTQRQFGLAGQSYGALLMLCAVTQRPDLFRAVVALAPIADLVRFHLFGVARSFISELGDPDDDQDFDVLYRLSPYHRVDDFAEYPAMLLISGDRDKRCDSMHARKMVARLHQTAHSKGPIVLDYDEQRGHKPVLPLASRIRSLTDRLTFIVSELGNTVDQGGLK
jgi:prolyl oligopeptidase